MFFLDTDTLFSHFLFLDMPRWIDCVALDGGISPMENAEGM